MQAPAAPAAVAPPPRDRTITLLAFAAFFSGAALRVCDSLLPRLGRDFAITPGVAGQVIVGFSIAYGAMQLLFGPLGDRYGKARMMCLALFGCAAGALASALAGGFSSLVVCRIAWGMAAAGVIPLAMAWIGDTVPYEQRQATLARFATGTLSGMMAGQLAGGLFADALPGWRGAFGTLSAGYAVVACLLLAQLRRTPAAPRGEHAHLSFVQQLLTVVRVPWARVVLAAVLAEGVFLLGPMSYLPTYLHDRFGITLSVASGMIALYAVGGLAYALTARRIVAALGERRMVLAGGLMMGAGFLGWWLSPLWMLAGPFALVVGFGTYLFHNTMQTHATQMAPGARGTSVALFASCLFGGQALGVSLAAWTVDHAGFVPLFLVAGIGLPVAGWLFSLALGRRERATAAAAAAAAVQSNR